MTKLFSNGSAKPKEGVDKSEKDAIMEHKEDIISDFKSTNFNGEIHIPPREIDIESLNFDGKHIKDRNHDVNLKNAKQYIKDAKMSYKKFIKGEEFENYIGEKGSTYVNITGNYIRTAFPKAEYNSGTIGILNTIDKHLNKKE